MKTVLLLCPVPPPFAGPEVATEILLKNLPRKYINYIHLKSNLKNDNWKKGKFDIEGLYKFCLIAFKLIIKLFDENISVVYLLLSSSKVGFLRDSIYILLSLLFGKKIVLHYRGGNFDFFYKKCGAVFRKYIEYILDKSDVIIVQAEILRKMFINITKTQLKVLYNGLDVNETLDIKQFNLNKTVILFVGHIAFSKGFFDLINVYKRIYVKHNLEMIFAGTLRYEGKKSKTQRNFLNGDVLDYYDKNSFKITNEIKDFILNYEKYNARYLGIISGKEKKKAFGYADILILPSYTEGFSVTVLEALSCGLPVLVSGVGALPEIVEENKNGWIVEPGNESSIEKKIEIAVKNKHRFNEISRNNLKYFKENFDIRKISADFEKILYEA